jgi:ABC-type uncharacterized transport system YnjBCD substrate-binding protein
LIKNYALVVVSVQRFALSGFPNQLIMENSKYMMLIDAPNVVRVKEIAPLWQYFSKNVKVVGVYGTLGLGQKILKVMVVVDKK